MQGVIGFSIGLVCGSTVLAGILLLWLMYRLAEDLPH